MSFDDMIILFCLNTWNYQKANMAQHSKSFSKPQKGNHQKSSTLFGSTCLTLYSKQSRTHIPCYWITWGKMATSLPALIPQTRALWCILICFNPSCVFLWFCLLMLLLEMYPHFQFSCVDAKLESHRSWMFEVIHSCRVLFGLLNL